MMESDGGPSGAVFTPRVGRGYTSHALRRSVAVKNTASSTSRADAVPSSTSSVSKLRFNNRRLSMALNEKCIENRMLREEKVQMQQEMLKKCEMIATLKAELRTMETEVEQVNALISGSCELSAQLHSHLRATEAQCLAYRRRHNRITYSSANESRPTDMNTTPISGKRRKLHRVLPSVGGYVISSPSIVLPRLSRMPVPAPQPRRQQPESAPSDSESDVTPVVFPVPASSELDVGTSTTEESEAAVRRLYDVRVLVPRQERLSASSAACGGDFIASERRPRVVVPAGERAAAVSATTTGQAAECLRSSSLQAAKRPRSSPVQESERARSSTVQEVERPYPVQEAGRPRSSPVQESEIPRSSTVQEAERPRSSPLQAAERPLSSSVQESERSRSSPVQESEIPRSSPVQEAERPRSSPLQAAERPLSSSVQESERPRSSTVQEVERPHPVQELVRRRCSVAALTSSAAVQSADRHRSRQHRESPGRDCVPSSSRNHVLDRGPILQEPAGRSRPSRGAASQLLQRALDVQDRTGRPESLQECTGDCTNQTMDKVWVSTGQTVQEMCLSGSAGETAESVVGSSVLAPLTEGADVVVDGRHTTMDEGECTAEDDRMSVNSDSSHRILESDTDIAVVYVKHGRTTSQHSSSVAEQAADTLAAGRSEKHNQTATNGDRHNQTGTNGDGHNQTGTNGDKHNQTGTNGDKHNQTGTNGDKHNQTGTNGDKHNQTGTRSVKRNCTGNETLLSGGLPTAAGDAVAAHEETIISGNLNTTNNFTVVTTNATAASSAVFTSQLEDADENTTVFVRVIPQSAHGYNRIMHAAMEDSTMSYRLEDTVNTTEQPSVVIKRRRCYVPASRVRRAFDSTCGSSVLASTMVEQQPTVHSVSGDGDVTLTNDGINPGPADTLQSTVDPLLVTGECCEDPLWSLDTVAVCDGADRNSLDLNDHNPSRKKSWSYASWMDDVDPLEGPSGKVWRKNRRARAVRAVVTTVDPKLKCSSFVLLHRLQNHQLAGVAVSSGRSDGRSSITPAARTSTGGRRRSRSSSTGSASTGRRTVKRPPRCDRLVADTPSRTPGNSGRRHRPSK